MSGIALWPARTQHILDLRGNIGCCAPHWRRRGMRRRRPVDGKKVRLAAALALGLTVLGGAGLGQAADTTERELEKYRSMLKDDPWSNPAMLDVDRGAELWKTPRGPKNATLEQCDLGKGPGVVDGAFAELPRYFAEADRVMDLEARLMWCMEKLQGFAHADLVKRPHPAGGQPVKELGAIAAWVASKSSGM